MTNNPHRSSPGRYVLPATTGHFKFTVTRDGVGLNTSCISYGATAAAVADALDALDYVDDLGGSTVVREGDGSSQYNYGFVYYMSASNASESLAGSVDMEIIGSGVDHGCARVSTLGFWDEPDNWDTGVAPTSTDEVGLTLSIATLSHVAFIWSYVFLQFVAVETQTEGSIIHPRGHNYLQIFFPVSAFQLKCRVILPFCLIVVRIWRFHSRTVA